MSPNERYDSILSREKFLNHAVVAVLAILLAVSLFLLLSGTL